MPDRLPGLEPGTLIAERFRIDERLGAGGYGTVYRATQLSIDRPVALKILHSDLAHREEVAARFEREARLASRVRHPNAVSVIDFGSDGDRLYLAMEYVEGPSLRRVLKRDGPMPWREVLVLADRICAALGAAHALGLVHRDLKPANILLTTIEGARQPVVIDFGLAKVFEGDEHETLTRPDTMIGTPAYMSPESVMGAPIDDRSDLYSLGVVLYEALSGAVPLKGRSPIETATMHIRESPPPLIERVAEPAPAALLALVHELLAKEAAHRPSSAEAVRARLAEITEDTDATIAVSVDPERAGRGDDEDERPPTMMAARPVSVPATPAPSQATTEPLPGASADAPAAASAPPRAVVPRSSGMDRTVLALLGAAAVLVVAIIAVVATGGRGDLADEAQAESTPSGPPSPTASPPAEPADNSAAADLAADVAPADGTGDTMPQHTVAAFAAAETALADAVPDIAELATEPTDGAEPPAPANPEAAAVAEQAADGDEPETPQRTERAPAREATVTIMVDPFGTVLIDGQVMGESPWTGPVSAGHHVARAECAGGLYDQQTFEAVPYRDSNLILRCVSPID